MLLLIVGQLRYPDVHGQPLLLILLHQQLLFRHLSKPTLNISLSVQYARELIGRKQEPSRLLDLNPHPVLSITGGQKIATSPHSQAFGDHSPWWGPLLIPSPTSPLPPRLNEHMPGWPPIETQDLAANVHKFKTAQAYVLNIANPKDWDVLALQEP